MSGRATAEALGDTVAQAVRAEIEAGRVDYYDAVVVLTRTLACLISRHAAGRHRAEIADVVAHRLPALVEEAAAVNMARDPSYRQAVLLMSEPRGRA